VVEAYRYIMQLRHEPAVLALSRQPLPTLDRSAYAPAAGVARGAYVLADAPGGNPEVILIASGSELILAVQAHELQKRFGFEPDQVAEAAREQVRRRNNHVALMR
jgi:transketolase